MSSKGRIVICMLRNDLRFHDNEVLAWANKNGNYLLPVYCFDPRHYGGTYKFGFPKTGPHRLKFLLESVKDLRNTLKSHGSGLVVRNGKPEVVIPELIQKLGNDAVHAVAFHEEVTQEELDVERALKLQCENKVIQKIWGHTLFHRDDLPFSVKQLPDVYTQFRKRVEGSCTVRQCIEMSEQLNPLPEGIEEGEIPSMQQLGIQEVAPDSRTSFPFSGGETSGLERVRHFLWETDAVATYKETRNGMIGAEYSTKFSAWLAHGCISPRYIYYEIKRYEQERVANNSTYWVIFELLWRDYFRYVALKYGNKLFYLSGIQGKHIPWKKDKELFRAWKEGRTGVPYVDANMREVAATGFMSNRGRQNVASFLTKDLKLDWRLGAEWFESMLIDHDVCSNYGNWLYSAGLGNDPREDRKFNMVKQGLDYDPEGDYVRLWVPELKNVSGGNVHTVWTMSNNALSRADVSLGETYPNPVTIAPEWSRHYGKSGGASARGGARGGGRGGGHGQGGRHGSAGQKRGIDFYFKGS
ncbi:cryptochrome DASH-like [Mercenaria mercenaria]|uniref:cryptochrome DASH-like n=1 Tax=Mercenaria mercenaria TaxID=6596 RepID=UPI00234EEBF1|nr:cryptochrome DASH-like [Mercenaria mercenaria]